MPLYIKPLLLSALVFPGLGQLYKEDRKKGVVLILLGNLLLALVALTGVMTFSQEYLAAFYPNPLTADLLRTLFGKVLSRPLFLAPLAGFLAVWTYAAMDAGLAPISHHSEE